MLACISRFDGRLDPNLVRCLVELTQSGLPLVDNPWDWIGEHLGLDEDAVLTLLRQLQDDGAIRRIAAVPNHYRLGYKHNGMTVWDVEDTHLPRLGQLLGSQPFVSHCYRRPRREGWHYNLFAMVHGRSAGEIEDYRAQIRQLLGDACRADEMLVSSRILKKTGLRV